MENYKCFLISLAVLLTFFSVSVGRAEALEVPAYGTPTVTSETVLEEGQWYLIEASGTYIWWGTGQTPADAEWYDDTTGHWFEDVPENKICFDLIINEAEQDWRGTADEVVDGNSIFLPHTYSSSHIYRLEWLGSGETIDFRIWDGTGANTYDNSGSLEVEISLAEPAAGQVPTYTLDCILPAPACTSVDMSPDGTKLCARMQYGDYDEGYRVFDANVIDICTDTTILNDCGGHWAPWQGRVSADSAYLWTTVYYGGYVKKIDLSDCSIDKAIDLGSWTMGLAFDSQRRYLYVGENCPGGSHIVVSSLKVIDTDTDVVVGSVTLNGQPGECIVVDPSDEYVYLVTYKEVPERLYKIRISDYAIEDTLPLPGVHDGISISPDGATVYVPHPSANLVYAIDTATLTIANTWSIESVEGFFASPDGTHALVTTSQDLNIRVFDLLSETVVQTIPVPVSGTGPYIHWTSPYWDTNRGKVYVNLPLPHPDGGVAVLSISEPVCTFSDDFEDGSIDAELWLYGGQRRGWNGTPAGSWSWSHDEIVDSSDGYLRAHVWGPYTGNTYGAEAWIRTKHNFNDGQDYLINFTWKPDFADTHYNIYYLQITDGYIPGNVTFHWQLDGEPGTTDLLWTQTQAGHWHNGWGFENQATPGKLSWSLEILASGLARLYDAPNKSGTLIREESLDATKPWYFRLMVNDGTSSGFGLGDAWFDLYDFSAVCKPAIVVEIDIKPGSCPNPVNVKSKGVLPVAILGNEDFDVATIDAASIRLADVAPIRSSYEDVAAPVWDRQEECECTTEGPDGYLDLTLKFETEEIVDALGDVNDGDVLTLTLTGVLLDETPIEGADCILVLGKAKSLHGADINKDGVVDMVDFAIIAENWLQSNVVQD